MTSQLDIKKLKTLETISVSGLPDNPVMPENKALSSILQAINGSLSTLTEFVLATKEPKEKRVTAISAVLELQAKLNHLSRLYTANVMRKRNNEEDIVETVKTTIHEAVGTCNAGPSYAQAVSSQGNSSIRTHSKKQKKYKVLISQTETTT